MSELALSDHLSDFNPILRCGRRSEGLETEHWSDPSFDDPMILFNDVVQVLSSDHLDRDEAAKTLRHLVDGFDAG